MRNQLMLVAIIIIGGGLVACQSASNVQSDSTQEEFYLLEPSWVNSEVNIEVDELLESPVLEQGVAGEWDDTDCLNPSVIWYNNQYYNYYSGYDGETWSTGLATSEDGINWEKYENNPVLYVGQDDLDNMYIAANGSAIVIDEKVYYYYHGENEEGAYISLAISEDGKNFVKNEMPVLVFSEESGSWDSNGVADPYVIEFNGKYYMYYLGMNDVYIQRLGVAISEDGINWTKSSSNPILDVGSYGTFDMNGLGEPSVEYYAPYFYMFYTGRDIDENRNIGYAISTDGVNWRKYSTEGMISTSSEWNSKVICDTTSILNWETGKIDVWYGGGDVAAPAQDLNGKLGYFTVDLSDGRDMTRIDNTENNDVVVLQDMLKGAYVEESQIWVSSELTTTLLNNKDSNTLNLEIYIPFEMHEVNSIDSLDMKIYINDELVEEVSYTETNMYKIEIENNAETSWLNIRIETNSSVSTEEDVRELSYLLVTMNQE